MSSIKTIVPQRVLGIPLLQKAKNLRSPLEVSYLKCVAKGCLKVMASVSELK